MRFQSAYRRSQQEEEIAQLKKTVDEINDWRKSFFEQQLDERIAGYLQCLERMAAMVRSRYACLLMFQFGIYTFWLVWCIYIRDIMYIF